MSHTFHREKQLQVVIVGAGVAGLATAYGLASPSLKNRFSVRILEKRSKEQILEAGFPIHISPSGLEAVSQLLTPADQHLFHLAKQRLPARHDGITFVNSRSRRIWYTYRKPFESNLIERGDLLDILKKKVGGLVEYEKKVISVKDLGGGAAVLTNDGETIRADLLIGADGMFSAVRKSIHPKDQFEPLPYVTCNFRLSREIMDRAADKRGINVWYGNGYSAAILPIERGGAYVALTLPAPIKDIPSALASLPESDLLTLIKQDPGFHEGRAFPLYSAEKTQVGKGRIVLIADAAHGMNPFCGAGASMALHDAAGLVKLLSESKDIDASLPQFHKNLAKTADPMIKLSKTLLWLAQGETPLGRFVRGTAFRFMECVERVLPNRGRMKRALESVVAAEELKRGIEKVG